MKKLINFYYTFIRVAWILLLSSICAVSLLYLAYLLPTSAMFDNITESYEIFKKENAYFYVSYPLYGLTGSLDNFTDALMIGTAGLDTGKSTLIKALLNERYNTSLESISCLIEGNGTIISYSRYWHGYLIFLKPLLLIFNYSQIRILNLIIQICLIAVIIFLMNKKCPRLLLPYITSIIFANPYVVSLSLQFSSIYYISNIGVLLVLLFYDKLSNKNKQSSFIYIFLIFGLLTSFFDLLTYPTLTLTFPLITLLYLKRKNDESFKEKLFFAFKMIFFWGVGYAGFWILKWIIASIFTNENVILNGITSFLFRTNGTINENVSKIKQLFAFIQSLKYLFSGLMNVLIIFIILFIIIGTIMFKKMRNDLKFTHLKSKIIPYKLIAIIPTIWLIFTNNHAYIHPFLAFRNYCGMIFAILAIFSLIFDNFEINKVDNISKLPETNGNTNFEDKKIAILIPCYNEHLTIKRTIERYKKALPNSTIYVYDNNSTDGSDTIAKEAGAIVIYEKQQGKGYVVRSMFKDIDADCYFMVDADDTYMEDNAQKMCEMILNGEADMVNGDRLSSTYFTEEKRKSHTFGNKIVRFLINTLYNTDVKDIMTGQRSFNKKFVKSFECKSNGFEIETEMTIFACDNNMVIKEIPVNYVDRQEGSFSKLNTYKDGFKVITTIFSSFAQKHTRKFTALASSAFAILSAIFIVPAILKIGVFGILFTISTLCFVAINIIGEIIDLIKLKRNKTTIL